MAQKVAAAINQAKVDGKTDISARAITESGRVDLFDAVRLNNDPDAANPIGADYYPTTGGDATYDGGDSNHERQKGQIIIAGNSVTYSLNTGILVAPSRDSDAEWAFPGSGRTLNDPNDLVAGITIENNLVAYSGQIGIDLQGNSNPSGSPVGAVPFARIVNNTVYGGTGAGIGIDIGPNASPTLLNNIVAGLSTGIRVDASSAALGTVIGGSLYQSNGRNLQGNVQEEFAEVLAATDPLFVDAAGGNFYLDHGSLAIDSAIDSLEERQDYYNTILQPVGMPVSPILAPETDMFGQLRRDDPSTASPAGFKDRGAIDRVDFVAPTSSVTVPLDNGPLDELATVAHDIKVVGEKVLQFTIQLEDVGGVGIDDASVVKEAIHLYRDLDEDTYLDPLTRDVELVEGDDYKMVYNATNDTIDLIPLSGLWAEGYDYTIVLDNSIRDRANNTLQPNRYSGTFNGLTVFQISLAGLDFGDAPDNPSIATDYPTLLASNGPRHVIYGDFHLGAGINSETDARTSANADGDQFDDGVALAGSGLLAGETANLTVYATLQNQNLIDLYGNTATVAAWFDFDNDGAFDTISPFVTQTVYDGVNTMAVAIPSGIEGKIKARFRFGSDFAAVTQLTGEAPNGEVEDYEFTVVKYLKDFGDAPNGTSAQGTPQSYPVLENLTGAPDEQGAWHSTNNTTVYLGTVAPDSELEGVPSPTAEGDDLARYDDEDGVDVTNVVFVADGSTVNTISVTASGEAGRTAYLNAWFDLNADGDWLDMGEQIVIGTDAGAAFVFSTGNTTITQDFTFTIPQLPGGLDQAISYARFRLSSYQGYEYGFAGGTETTGVDVVDGEVEDYQVFIVNEARDYGDAPDNASAAGDYPTLISSNGASHAVVPGLSLGSTVDAEYDGQPNSTATGDDITFPTGGDDDEDGVLFEVGGTDALSRLVPGGIALVDVNVTDTVAGQAYLYGWIDFNQDGDWDDPGEQVFGDASGGLAVDPDSNILSINIPELADPTDPTAISVLGDTYARFRLSTEANLSYDGHAIDGEVEDYLVTIEIGDSVIQGKKFNDLDADGVYDSSVQGTIPPIDLETIGIGPTVLNNTDNTWTGAISLGFDFEFYGGSYSNLYVSPNGLVSFVNPGTFNPSTTPGFPSGLPVIAPFWADADLTASGGTVHRSYGVSDRGNPFIQIDWNNVAYYDHTSISNLDLRNTFSLYIEDAPAGDIVAFVYDSMQWTTGDQDGTSGFGGFGAEIGFNAGDGVQYYSEMRPNSLQGLNALLASADNGVLGYRMDPTTGLLAKGEPGLAGVTVYLDYDNDGVYDSNEPSTVTRPDDLSTTGIDETGDFEFTGLFSGSYTVREVLDTGWVQTYPDAELTYLPDVNGNKIQAIAGSDILDGDTFLVSDGTTTLQLEFENTNLLNGVSGFSVAVEYSSIMSAANVANAIADAINSQAVDMTATVSGDVVILEADTVSNPLAVVSIDPQNTMLVVLGNSRINADRSYTIEVGAGETYSGVLFGNHKLTTISVGDVSVAEGPAGQFTTVNVVFERRGSFGAPVTVEYYTEDGTAMLSDNDYVGVSSGTFTFNPQDEPQATWNLKSITHNLTNDYDYHVANDSIVFEVADDNDWEILVYNDTVGGDPLQLTNNLVDDRFADTYRVGTGVGTGIDPGEKIYIVWAGVDRAPGQSDYEIFLSEVYVTDTGLVPRTWIDPATGNPTTEIQLTHNETDDKSPRVSGSHVTWWGVDEVVGDTEIFMYEIDTTDDPSVVEDIPVIDIDNISNNDYNDYDPVIDGDNVVWHSLVGQGTEIFLYDGSGTRRVTNNQADNAAPQISGNVVVWQGRDGSDFEVFMYEIDTWSTTQLTADSYDDVTPKIDGENIVWQGGPSSNREIYLYNVVDGGSPSNISDAYGLDERPEIDGSRIVWHSYDGYDWEVMFLDLSKPFLPLNVSNNLDYDWGPQVSGELLVWRSNDGQDYEIVVASQNEPVARQTVQLTIIGDYNLEDDEVFHVGIRDVTINGITLVGAPDMFDSSARGDIGIYNDDGQLDYGDAPASYFTRIGDNGARHVTHATDSSQAVYYLGAGVDAEANGLVSADAKGDDISSSRNFDDEDGVSIRSHWLPGGTVTMVVTASKAGILEGWVDYNADGNFGDAFKNVDRDEQLVFTDQGMTSSESILLDAGENVLTISVPETAVLGDTFARFRFSELGGLSYLGSAPNGEVEDYRITITTDQPGIVITPTNSSNKVIEGGANDTYQVVLTAEPTNIVRVNIAGDADVTTTVSQLQFTPDNWDVPQTVTITAIDDDIAEFPADNIGTITHTLQSLDLAYNDLVVTPMTVTVTDNDLAKVQVFRTGGSTRVKEDGTLTDTYELVLTSEPVGAVTVTVNAGSQLRVADTAAGTGNQTVVLTFTPSDWNTRQTVYVTAVDDNVAEGDPSVPLANREHSAIITHWVDSLTDAMYEQVGGSVDSVAVQIGDNDSPGVEVLVATGSVTVTEGGTTPGTYQVRLLSQPTDTVTIGFLPDSQLQTTSTSPLEFTASNWNVFQTVTLVAVDDFVAEGPHTGQVTHSVSSPDPFYSGLQVAPLIASITDNDTAGVLITDNGSIDVAEGGQTDTYQVQLTSQPTADVTIIVSRGSQLRTDVSSLTFTPANWSTPQTVVVSAFDDNVAEGSHTAAIAHILDSNDAVYDAIEVPLRTVNITDNDTASVLVSAAGTTLQVAEGGATTQYEIVLTSQPTSRVTVTLATDGQISATPTEIAFDVSDWSQPRVITVRALDDSVAEGTHTSLVSHTVTSTDANYNGLAVSSVNVSIEDNDTAGITFTETVGSTNVSEAGATDVYVVKLKSQPTSNVTIQMQTDGQVKTLPSTLTFTPQNWNQAQTVAVSPVADLIAEGDHTGTISHLVNSADPNYASLTPADLIVHITDNDTAGVVITQSGGSSNVTEGGATDDYTVVLTSEPTANVTVNVTPGNEVTTVPTQLTFTPDNWDQPQTVTISAVDDSEIEETESAVINHTVSSQDAMYNGLAISQLWVEVTDNDKDVTNGTLNLLGTSGNDTLDVVRGNVLTVTLNSQLVYQGTDVHTVTFDGLAGYDRVNVTGSADYEELLIQPNDLSFDGTNFSLTATRIERAVVESGGGDDRVEIQDSAGDDTVSGSPTDISFTGNGFSHRADNFSEAQVYARAGGYDTIELRDSQGKDKAKIESDDIVKLFNYSSYYIRAKFFEEVSIISTGGSDLLRAWDTPADDTVKASYNEIVINTGSNLANPGVERQKATVTGFENVTVYATTGGYDTLTMYDSPGDDKAILRSHKATIEPRDPDNPSPYAYQVVLRGFDEVHAVANAGGDDYARIHDTSLVDLLVANYTASDKTFASLSKPVNATDMALMYDVLGFETVKAVNDYGVSPKNQKDVDEAVDFLLLTDSDWEDI